jgi:hypothetical protein
MAKRISNDVLANADQVACGGLPNPRYNAAVEHADLLRLWRLADTLPRPKGRAKDATFEPIGLILERPLRRAAYGTTPANTLTFARTGGDGVHFSFVLRDGEVHAASPVVMGVPMHERPSIIVGRDLLDFLALGVGCGFALERIASDPDAFFDAYPSSRELDAQLRRIRTTFDVAPWREPKERLAELRALESLLEAPIAPPEEEEEEEEEDEEPIDAVAFWEDVLSRERARPEDERDPEREAHMERRLREEVRKNGP